MQPAQRAEPAFTMLELLVSMILLAIAFAIVGTTLVQALSGSGTSTSGAVSDTAAARVTARFQDDIAVVESADRKARLVREQVVLDAALRQDANASSDNPAAPNASVDLEDVLIATPTRFRVQAEVDRQTTGVECVTWDATTNDTRFQIMRTVQRSGCGATISEEVLLTGRSDARGANVSPFTYRLMCNRTLCGADSLAPPATPCQPWPATSVDDRKQRRWIIGVQANFVAHAGRSATSSSANTTMNIRSREEHMWRTALGC
jgi:prepilin-type N-terminal cleavage/methylation domain-containing protein